VVHTKKKNKKIVGWENSCVFILVLCANAKICNSRFQTPPMYGEKKQKAQSKNTTKKQKQNEKQQLLKCIAIGNYCTSIARHCVLY